jgi:urease accessory protein
VSGSLALTCALRAGRSRVVSVRYDGLSRVSRAQRDGDAAKAIVAYLGPGILGGDVYGVDVHVDAAARLVIEGQMATPVFARDVPSSVRARWRVERGASLIVRAEPLMLDRHARHAVHATLDVASGGFAALAEIVTVAGDACAKMRTTARIDGRLAVRDACDVRGRDEAVATVIVVCDDEPRRAALADAMQVTLLASRGVRGGVGVTHGALVLRATSTSVWALRCLVDRVTR